jgi:hypothetical protein
MVRIDRRDVISAGYRHHFFVDRGLKVAVPFRPGPGRSALSTRLIYVQCKYRGDAFAVPRTFSGLEAANEEA